MSTLEITQQKFYTHIFQQFSDNLSFIDSTFPRERLEIYRHNVFENLTQALSVTFPGVWILLGSDCANSVAKDFFRETAHLPLSGCLDEWGQQFPEFLAQQSALEGLPYLKDYAQYEWCKQQAYLSDIAVHIVTAEDLGNIPNDALGEMRFSLIPSIAFLTSSFPLAAIQQIVDDPQAAAIRLTPTQTNVMIARPADIVLSFWLDADFFFFFNQLREGVTLSLALNTTIAQYPLFDLGQALHCLLREKLLASINCDTPPR